MTVLLACCAIEGVAVPLLEEFSPLRRFGVDTIDSGTVGGDDLSDAASSRTRLGVLLIGAADDAATVVLLHTGEGRAVRAAILARTPSPICAFWELAEGVKVSAPLLQVVKDSCAYETGAVESVVDAVFGAVPLNSGLIST